jgi:uncharacterized membrane protein YphA (DoxX/SURF4 family)
MQWWTRYWSAPGGRIAAALVRIALAISVVLLLPRIREGAPVAHPAQMAASIYHPVGILQVFRSPPPASLIELAGIVAYAGAIAMLIGLCTRAATVATALAMLVLASQAMSYQPSWSHDFNVVLLALIAFVGARGGDALAVDAVIRWLRRPAPVAATYQWSVRLVQLAVGLMFLSACVLKLRSGGLHWALSDNLRHQLLARYDLIGAVHRPPIVDWLLARSWRYEGSALLNLISQAMPVVAIVLVDRPWIRALAAVFFVIEVAALYAVMELGNPSWFPLAAVFIDWDRLWAWIRRTPPAALAPGTSPVRLPRAAAIFVAGFVVVDLVISFAPRVDEVLRTFPFSRFPMFAIMRAKQPYAEHQPYEMIAGRIELVTDRPIDAWIQAEIDRDYGFRTLHRETDLGVLRARTAVTLDELRRRFPTLALRGVRVYATMYQVPAYPAAARLEPHDLGILGELVDGSWITHAVALPADGRIALAADPALAGAPLMLYRDGLPVPGPPPVPDAAGTVQLPAGRDMLYLIARVAGPGGVVRPYVVVRRVRGYW